MSWTTFFQVLFLSLWFTMCISAILKSSRRW
jgi:hypothetical protein